MAKFVRGRDVRQEQARFRRLIRNKRNAETALAQLRHAYMQLAAGTVKDQKQFADGLIAPQIRALEKILSGEGTPE